VLCFCGALVAPAVASAGPTIVSLTFDDGLSDQYLARSMLAQDGLHATFYVNSNNVGTSSSFMSWSQLSGLAADGNEIGGHTLDHVDLTSVSSTEATRQVCDDRQAIISHGFTATDFDYPYGASNPTVESIVRGCGYSSGRRAWGLCPIGQVPPNCPDGVGGQYPFAEPIPPRNIWKIAVTSIRASHTLADIEESVTNAESSGGGWVTILMHHVCDGCDPTNGGSVSPAILSAFLDWLAPRAANGTYVRTMRDVISDTTPPASSIACNGGTCGGWYTGTVSVSLSAIDTGTAVTAIRYTTDGTDPTTSSPLYTGPITVSSTTTVKYRAWDMAGNVEATKSQLIQVDTLAPSVRITSPRNGATVSGNVKIVASAADDQTGVASVSFYIDGSLVGRATSSPWQARWNTKKARGGQHVLRAVATDRAGNSRVSAAIARTAVIVVEKGFRCTLSTKRAQHGLVDFKVVNKGKLAHNFKIAGKKTKLLRPNQKATLKVRLKKGKYRYLCTVPGHGAGMRGVFKVI
jgi:peptidoglycan/xylan/chitin deacetylase (PgdA/CDA1 family)/plastocyanin